MQVSKVYIIKELAQDFVKDPQIKTIDNNAMLTYEYEGESGEIERRGITFQDVLASKYTSESDMEVYMVKAYNAVSIVENSPWPNEFGDSIVEQGYKHFIVYFDDFGAYEFLAQNFEKGD
jgi:hypothetical protein